MRRLESRSYNHVDVLPDFDSAYTVLPQISALYPASMNG